MSWLKNSVQLRPRVVLLGRPWTSGSVSLLESILLLLPKNIRHMVGLWKLRKEIHEHVKKRQRQLEKKREKERYRASYLKTFKRRNKK